MDPQNQNKAITREHSTLLTPVSLLTPEGDDKNVRSKNIFKLDYSKESRQLQLDEENSKLYTFIKPEGRYCYQRLLFGISSAPERPPLHLTVSAIEKGAFWLHSTTVANFTLYSKCSRKRGNLNGQCDLEK